MKQKALTTEELQLIDSNLNSDYKILILKYSADGHLQDYKISNDGLSRLISEIDYNHCCIVGKELKSMKIFLNEKNYKVYRLCKFNLNTMYTLLDDINNGRFINPHKLSYYTKPLGKISKAILKNNIK